MRRQLQRRVPVEPHVVERGVARDQLPKLADHRLVLRRRVVGVVSREHGDRIAQRLRVLPPVRLLQLVPLARARVPPIDAPLLRLAEHDVGIRWILRRVEAVAAADRVPHVIVNGSARPPAGTAPRIVVLQATAHAIGRVHIVADGVELSHGNTVGELEVAAAVPRDRDAAVISQDKVVGIGRVPPQCVIVDVHALGRVPHRAAAVAREEEGRPVDEVGVIRRHPHAGVVEGPRVVRVHELPRLAPVRGAVESRGVSVAVLVRLLRGLRLDHRVHHLRVARRDRDLQPTQHRLGKTAALHLLPRVAGVRRLPDRAPRAPALEEVRPAHALPTRRPQDVRVPRMHVDVDEPGLVGHEVDALPRVAAVGGPVQAPLLVVAPRVAERGHVDPIRLRRMDDDAPDRLRVLETFELPREAAVNGLVDPAPRRDRVPRILLPRPRPHDVGVAGRDREVAHRDDPLVVEHGTIRGAVVRRLPDPARGADHEEGSGAGDPLHVGHAAGHVRRPDRPPFHLPHEGFVGRRLLGGGARPGPSRSRARRSRG